MVREFEKLVSGSADGADHYDYPVSLGVFSGN
jgi:hypothetical protein